MLALPGTFVAHSTWVVYRWLLWNSWKLVHFLVLQKTTAEPGCGGAYAASLWKEATFDQQNSVNGVDFSKADQEQQTAAQRRNMSGSQASRVMGE